MLEGQVTEKGDFAGKFAQPSVIKSAHLTALVIKGTCARFSCGKSVYEGQGYTTNWDGAVGTVGNIIHIECPGSKRKTSILLAGAILILIGGLILGAILF